MIRKLICKVLRRRHKHILLAKHYGISRGQIDPYALKICDRLQSMGFEAYIVGGAIRDLMLGKTPKDFDVATSATPEQVRHLFHRARIIGRRFRIVHVPFYGNQSEDVIEVTTFRGCSDTPADETGRLIHDNVYGSLEEDALRRDFTINAFYYDPNHEKIIDFHHGAADIKARHLVVIGDPEQRYREDPVRMLRAVRLATKLDLSIVPSSQRPLQQLAYLLENIPPARLFDERIKLLLSGRSWDTLVALQATGLYSFLFPILDTRSQKPAYLQFLKKAFENTDERVAENKPISIGFLFAALLWHKLEIQWQIHQDTGASPIPAMTLAISDIRAMEKQLAIPSRYGTTMREIWFLQPRFEQRSGRRPFRLLEQERFRAAYDFLVLRANAGLADLELVAWWTRFQSVDHTVGTAMISDLSQGGKTNQPKRSRKRRTRQTPKQELIQNAP